MTDQTDPIVNVPSDIVVAAVDASGTPASQTSISLFLASATASDNVDGVITLINNNAPSVFPLGITTVTFDVSDAAGNTNSNTALVSVVDSDAPVITLIGDASQTIDFNGSYVEQGATVTDNVDTGLVAVASGSVNNTALGMYSIDYNAIDAAGNIATTVSRMITVQDLSAPVVTAPATIEVAALDASGTPRTNSIVQNYLNSATALDVVDGILIPSNDAPTTLPLGETTITFSVTDAAGFTGNAQSILRVTDLDEPVINLIGSSSINLLIGDVYVEQGITINDNVDGDISANVVITGSVNTSVVGLYNVQYNVADSAGNAATTVLRQVSVQDVDAPIVTPPVSITVAAADASGTPDTDVRISNFLSSAFAVDAVDGFISTVSNDAPSQFPIGVTTVTFSADDLSSNTGNAQAQVTISDLTKPIISLNGSASPMISTEDSYVELGASASDNVDGDLSAQLIIAGGVNTNVPGVYNIIYTVADTANNQSTEIRAVTVQDLSAPVLTAENSNVVLAIPDVNGLALSSSEIQNVINSVSAFDDVEGLITTINNDAPSVFLLGDTTVTFDAQDSEGNQGFTQIIFTLEDQEAPVISLQGSSAIEIELEESFSDPGFSASDNVDGDLSNDVQVASNVNTGQAGTYVVTYQVADNAGNQTSMQRTIVVKGGSSSGGGGGSIGLLVSCLLALFSCVRVFRQPLNLKNANKFFHETKL